MRRYILPLILSLVIALLVGGLSLLYAGAPVKTQFTFEGTQLLVPENIVLATLAAQGDYFAGTFTDNDGVELGFVTLDRKDAQPIGKNQYIVPFAVERLGPDVSVYAGLFEPDESGIFKHRGSLFLGNQVLLQDIMVRDSGALVVRFLTHGAEQAVADSPDIEATVFGTTFGGKLEESYRIINGAFGDLFFDNPIPGEVLNPGVYAVSGEARGSWFFEADALLELRDMKGDILASAIASAEGDWMTQALVSFSSEIIIPENYAGEAVLVFKKDNPSGLPENDAELSEKVFIESHPSP